jgi:hypothetical protein
MKRRKERARELVLEPQPRHDLGAEHRAIPRAHEALIAEQRADAHLRGGAQVELRFHFAAVHGGRFEELRLGAGDGRERGPGASPLRRVHRERTHS